MANSLLVDALDDHLVRVRQFEFDACRRLDGDGVGIAEGELNALALHLGAVTGTDDLQSLGITLVHALDHAREAAAGDKKIGTTGRGIGPAYEDKIARRTLRVADLFDKERFVEQVRSVLKYHNFVLENYLGAKPLDADEVIDHMLSYAERLRPMVCDVSAELHQQCAEGKQFLFEGAQGSMLDIDHGTYPYVTSSNTVAGSACAGAGVGPHMLNYVLGITKAYCTRVGEGPFTTELHDPAAAAGSTVPPCAAPFRSTASPASPS